MTAGGGIKIADAASAEGASAPADGLMVADEEMARRLQAQMDAQAYGASGGGNRCGPLPPCALCHASTLACCRGACTSLPALVPAWNDPCVSRLCSFCKHD